MLQLHSDSTCQRVSEEHPGEKRWSGYSNEGHINTQFIQQIFTKLKTMEMTRKGIPSAFMKLAPPAGKECYKRRCILFVTAA